MAENLSPDYVRIIELNAKKLELDGQIRELKPKAIKELRSMGYSYDRITRMLMVGKLTAIKYSKEEENFKK